MAVIINELEVVLDESESGAAAGPGGAGAAAGAEGAPAPEGATPGMARRLTPMDLDHIARRRDEQAARLYAG